MKYCLYNLKMDSNMKVGSSDINNLEILEKHKQIDVKDLIIYNSEKKQFFDVSGKRANLDNEILFPISGICQIEEMQVEAEKQSIELISTLTDDDYVQRWINFYKPKRKISIIKGSDFLDPIVIESIREEVGERFFFKTLDKNYSAIAKVDYLMNENSVLFNALVKHSDEEFIISEAVDIIEDEIGKLEYRCVVIKGVLKNISRTTNVSKHEISLSVINKAKDIMNELGKKIFPISYVLDLFEYINQKGELVLDILECNPICFSGLYLYNSFISEDKDLTHKNSTISTNNNAEHTETSKNFDEKNSFAETVKRYTGELVGMNFYIIGKKDQRYLCDECLGDEKKELNFNEFLSKLKPYDGDDITERQKK